MHQAIDYNLMVCYKTFLNLSLNALKKERYISNICYAIEVGKTYIKIYNVIPEVLCSLGIKIRKLKMDLNMEALCIGCRNKH